MTPISILFVQLFIHFANIFYASYVAGTMKTFDHLFSSVVII